MKKQRQAKTDYQHGGVICHFIEIIFIKIEPSSQKIPGGYPKRFIGLRDYLIGNNAGQKYRLSLFPVK